MAAGAGFFLCVLRCLYLLWWRGAAASFLAQRLQGRWESLIRQVQDASSDVWELLGAFLGTTGGQELGAAEKQRPRRL